MASAENAERAQKSAVGSRRGQASRVVQCLKKCFSASLERSDFAQLDFPPPLQCPRRSFAFWQRRHGRKNRFSRRARFDVGAAGIARSCVRIGARERCAGSCAQRLGLRASAAAVSSRGAARERPGVARRRSGGRSNRDPGPWAVSDVVDPAQSDGRANGTSGAGCGSGANGHVERAYSRELIGAGDSEINLPNKGFVSAKYQAAAKAAMMAQRPGLVSNVFDKLERPPSRPRRTRVPPTLVCLSRQKPR